VAKEELDIKSLEVKTELDCGAVVIKLYEVPIGLAFNRNITGENKQGEVIWQVEDVWPSSCALFMNIKPFDNERIIAYNWVGMDYYIDIPTGTLDPVNKNARPW